MSHTASKTWVSVEAKEYETFNKVRENVSHVAPNSPFVPQSWPEWIAHRLAVKEDSQNEIVRRLTARESERKAEIKARVSLALGGKGFDDYLTRVLSQDSIWIPSTAERLDRPQAPWPCHDELKHEGYHRSRSGYNRFPPLPRVPGNVTVNWKQRAPLTQFPFDEVGRPTMACEEKPPEMEEEMMLLIGYELMKELDN